MAHSLNKAFIQAYRKSQASGAAESVTEESAKPSAMQEKPTPVEPAATAAEIETPIALDQQTSATVATSAGEALPAQAAAKEQTASIEPAAPESELPAELDSQAGVIEEDFDFIVRVDTASMEIPQPHFMRPRGTKQLAEVATATPVQPIEAKAEQAEQGVRETIAQQMQASASHNDSLESGQVFLVEPFWGSLPNVVPEEAASSTSSTDEIKSTTPTEMQITAPPSSLQASPTPQAETTGTPLESESQVEAAQPDRDMTDEGNTPPTDTPEATNVPSSPAELVASRDDGFGDFDNAEADHEQRASSDVEAFEPMELEAPTSPALSADEVRSLVEEYADKMSQKGEIFRLDAPSYQEPANGEEADESGELSSIVENPPAISTQDQASRLEAAYEAEEELRRVQTQRFNPAWEVDGFQWPEVCNELTKMTESGLEQVASNLVRASEEGLHVMAVTSPQAGEGRTTVACCLAKLAGANGLRVAFVDGDVENPSLSNQTNLDIDFDWRTAIINQMPLEEVAIHSVEDEVTLVPLVQPVHETEIASDDNRIAYMLQELSDYFDLVIVDMGHMESAKSLVSGLGQQGIINAVVTVVDNRISSRERIESCLRRIRRSGISSVGLVENFAA